MNTVDPQTVPSIVVSKPAPIRQDFLEGLRGLAAFYVTMYHANLEVGWIEMSTPLRLFTKSIKMGHYAVAVFIVLSGYCLMLPVARSADGQLRGGFTGYIYRRARRILPPYFVVLAISIAVIALFPRLQQPSGILWDQTIPSLTTGSILSHIFVVHNFDAEWVTKINSPMWSVATEWQIYFIFPLLLWVWRRQGMLAAVLLGFALGYSMLLISRETGDRPSLESCPWYIGLFALGMAASQVASRDSRTPTGGRVWSWLLGMFAMIGVAVAFSIVERKLSLLPAGIPQRVILDGIFGLSTACLLIFLANSTHSSRIRKNPLLWLLETRVLLWVGSFSYTLYLVNDPVLAWANIAMIDMELPDIVRYRITFFGVIPLTLVISYLMYLAVEKRFLNQRKA